MYLKDILTKGQSATKFKLNALLTVVRIPILKKSKIVDITTTLTNSEWPKFAMFDVTL